MNDPVEVKFTMTLARRLLRRLVRLPGRSQRYFTRKRRRHVLHQASRCAPKLTLLCVDPHPEFENVLTYHWSDGRTTFETTYGRADGHASGLALWKGD